MSSPETLSRLRGAPVEVDARRFGRVLVALFIAGLALSSALLFAAGAAHNAGVDRLRQHGVPVEVTVSGCRGLLGGSGSNPVGYTCWGTFVLDGQRYREGIPGNSLLAPGALLTMLSVPGDPSLLAAPGVVAAEHPSAKVFVLPAALLGALALSGGVVVVRLRRGGQPALRSSLRLVGGRRLGGAGGV